MGDDGVVDVHGLLEIGEHTVGCQRRALGFDLVPPFADPLFARGRYFHSDWCGVTRGEIGQRIEQSAQGGLRVTDDRDLSSGVFVDVARIQGGVDDDLAGRHGDAERSRGEAAADAENDVRAIEEAAYRTGHGAPGGTQGQRMALVESTLAFEARATRNGQAPGELRELGTSLGIVHPLPGMVDQRFRLTQQSRRRRQALFRTLLGLEVD